MTTLLLHQDAAALADTIAHLCEDAHPSHDGWRARCPSHQGQSDTSLSIDPAEDRVLVQCFGGCDQQAVVQALGLTLADLFVTARQARTNGHRTIVATYDYHDAQGTLLHQTIRYEPKTFRQRRPDPAAPGAYVWNLQGIEPVLYHLPQVLQAVRAGTPIYVVEGEKDADLLTTHGLVATCNPMGANKWRPSYSDTLRDADVILLADYDAPGLRHATLTAHALHGIARTVKVIESFHTDAKGSDVADWLAAGGTRAAFDAIVAAAACYVPPAGPATPRPPARPATSRSPATGQEPPLPYSDYFNARAFVQDHGHTVRYCYAWKSWLVWTGTHWQRDEIGHVHQLAKVTIKRFARQLEQLNDEFAAKALLAHIKKSLNKASLDAMVRTAQDEPGIPLKPDTLDVDPWVLNCTNGTLDLRTGELHPHRQEDLLTKCLTMPYEPDALCPTWQAFLWRIMGGSQGDDSPDMSAGELEARQMADTRATALIDFLQRALGYTLTGSTREQCLFMLQGVTKTGKSTFLATLRKLLGPYGQQADMESFMHKDRPEVRNDLADLAGSRFVCALEGQQGRRLAESLIKQMTGGVDLLKARFLFQEHFTFKPQFKIFLGTNHLPVINDTDSAIWERIHRVPFTVQIPPEDRDKTLEDKLQAELPGVLTWAVQGCLAWQRLGDLQVPEVVKASNAAYRQEMDNVGRFLDACCLIDPAVRVKMGELYSAYKTWCESIGETAVSLTAMGKRLDEKGVEKRSSNIVWRIGLGLKDQKGP